MIVVRVLRAFEHILQYFQKEYSGFTMVLSSCFVKFFVDIFRQKLRNGDKGWLTLSNIDAIPNLLSKTILEKENATKVTKETGASLGYIPAQPINQSATIFYTVKIAGMYMKWIS